MSTAVYPGTAPNTGMFFAPEFHMVVNFANPVAQSSEAAPATMTLAFEVEWVVEFSGSKQWIMSNFYFSLQMSTPGINVKPEIARNRIFCSCCGGDLDVDEIVRDRNDRVLKTVTPVV